MPGTPATTPHFAIPRWAGGDAADYPTQTNASIDQIDSAIYAHIGTRLVPEAVHLVGAVGEPAFKNSWGNWAGPEPDVGFWKDPLGYVNLQGVFWTNPGMDGTVAFTLPVGYRPLDQCWFSIVQFGSGAPVAKQCEVKTNGDVLIWGVSGVSINGVYFRTN